MIRLDVEKLYRVHFMRLYSYVMTLVRSPSDAEEITQNTFVKALSAEKSFKGKSNEFTWLCSIAKNLSIDLMRRRKRFDEIPDETQEISENNQEKDLIERESSLEIHKILHTLDEPYREVFELRVFGELSFAEIADIFGKSESWARVTYHRARIKIKERIVSNG